MSRKKDPGAGKRYKARQKAIREGKPIPKWAQVRERNAPAPRRATKAAMPSNTLAATVAGIVDGTRSATVQGTVAGTAVDTAAAMPIASPQVPYDATLVATRKGSKALVSTAIPTPADAPPDAVAGAARAALGHLPSGPLARALGGALTSGAVGTAGAGLMAANYSLVLGLADHLLGPGVGLFGWTLGESAAVGVVATEFVCGHVLTERLHEGHRRDPLTVLVFAAVLAICASEFLGSYVREVQAAQAAQVAAVHEAAEIGAKAHRDAPSIQSRPQETMPDGLTAREQRNWRADQRAKDRAFMQLQEHMAAAEGDRETKAQESQRKAIADARSMHSVFEGTVLQLWAIAMSIGAVVAAGAAGAFVRNFLAIFGALAAMARRRDPVAAQAPVAGPGAGKAVAPPTVAPTPAGGFLDRLASWPIVQMFTRRRQVAGGAA